MVQIDSVQTLQLSVCMQPSIFALLDLGRTQAAVGQVNAAGSRLTGVLEVRALLLVV